MLSSCFFTIA